MSTGLRSNPSKRRAAREAPELNYDEIPPGLAQVARLGGEGGDEIAPQLTVLDQCRGSDLSRPWSYVQSSLCLPGKNGGRGSHALANELVAHGGEARLHAHHVRLWIQETLVDIVK